MAGNEGESVWPRRVQLASIVVIVVSFLALARLLPVTEIVIGLRGWIDSLGLLGPAVYGSIYIVATVLFLPGLILTVAGGAFFGLGVGFVTVSISSTIGACCAFLIARYLARDRVAEVAAKHRKFEAIDAAIEEGGWRIVALLRLSPAVPFNLQNYLFGLTPVRFLQYALASWLAMMPGTFMYVYIGHVTGAAVGGHRERGLAEWALLIVGLLATIVVSAYVTVLAKRKLNAGGRAEEIEADSPESSSSDTVSGSLTGVVVSLLLAVGLGGSAAYAHMYPGTVKGLLAGLFGPPKAELAEAYDDGDDGATFDHGIFDALLREHVDEHGSVDYQGLGGDSARLDAYLEAVAAAPFDELGRDEKLALLINAYNAATVRLILDHYPIDSIKSIPKRDRWQAARWTVGGRVMSLDQLEHHEIRPNFVEPRIHFALVCAAVGCPPLRSEAFTAARLEEQLEIQTRYVHEHDRWFRRDGDTIWLTPLYDWYGGDFEQVAGSVPDYVDRYVAGTASDDVTIKWLDYDWSLNDRASRSSDVERP